MNEEKLPPKRLSLSANRIHVGIIIQNNRTCRNTALRNLNFRAHRYYNISVTDAHLFDFAGRDSAYVQMNYAKGSGLIVCSNICTLR
jgi:hypothetical protein